MNDYTVAILLVLFMFTMLVLAIRISAFMIRRDICTVVNTFRKYGASNEGHPLTLESMNLIMRALLFSLRLLRDYKPWALQTLNTAGIIRSPLEGFYYLSEQELSRTNIPCAAPPPASDFSKRNL